MVSKLKSPLLSAPHTLHLFRLSRELNPTPNVLPRMPEVSKAALVFESSTPSAASAAAFSCAILSASRAASSASGESGMVSKLDMLGLRDLVEVGVEGTEDEAKEPG
jgi:hypothetical protein